MTIFSFPQVNNINIESIMLGGKVNIEVIGGKVVCRCAFAARYCRWRCRR